MAGRPAEYFNPAEQKKPWMRSILGDCNMVDGLPRILSAGTTPNGVFGVKIHWSHLRYLGMSINGEWSEAHRTATYEYLRARLPGSLSEDALCALVRSRFSSISDLSMAYQSFRSWIPDLRVIWLRRKNMVARAISHFRAKRTGVWHQAVTAADRAPESEVPPFDLDEIRILHCLGSLQEDSWQRLFRELEISPHCVIYEELVADYATTVRRALEFLDIGAGEVPIPPPSSRKQSDTLSEQWEERYRDLSRYWSFSGFGEASLKPTVPPPDDPI